MVTHINVSLDDDTADRAKAVKNQQGWTWEEFIMHATEEFDGE